MIEGDSDPKTYRCVGPAERNLLKSGDYTVKIIPWDCRLNEWRKETK